MFNMKNIKYFVIALMAFAVASCSTAPKISKGSVVKVEYKGTLADGSVFDSTEGKQPLTFLVGSGQVIPEFEKQITMLAKGQSKKFKVGAAEAYGESDPKKVVTLPRDGRFKSLQLKEGAVVFANNKTPEGKVVQTPMKVVKLSEKEVTMDYNHPLAGKDLTFEVKLVDVAEPKVDAAAQAEQPEAKTEA